MIKLGRQSQTIIILITGHDLYLQKLINSFMHRKFVGEAVQPMV